MTEHKFTDDEIIRALERCTTIIGSEACEDCPMQGKCREDCDILEKSALDLINRQKAEIERLEAPRFMVTPFLTAEDNLTPLAKLQKIVIYDEPLVSIKRIDEEGIKSEAIKEFAERLKEKHRRITDYDEAGFGCQIFIVEESYIDNLVKEMTEDATEHTKVSPHEICVVCGDQVPEGRQICYMCETGQEFLNKKKE